MHMQTFAAVRQLLLISAGWVRRLICRRIRPAQDDRFRNSNSTLQPQERLVHACRVPGNWNIEDKSAEGEVVVSIGDPPENAIVVVRVYEPRRSLRTQDATR